MSDMGVPDDRSGCNYTKMGLPCNTCVNDKGLVLNVIKLREQSLLPPGEG